MEEKIPKGEDVVEEFMNYSQFMQQYEEELRIGVANVKHMSCEMIRIISFKNLPHKYHRFMWPPKLANAGFYFDSEKKNTICFVCGFSVPFKFWLDRKDPYKVHKDISFECTYINGIYTENVASQTEGQKHENVPNLQQDATNILKHKDDVAFQINEQRSKNFQQNIKPAHQSQKESQITDNPQEQENLSKRKNMKCEECRLMTFVTWYNNDVSPIDLANAGFFYTGREDSVECAFCQNRLKNWEKNDQPDFEHRRHYPRCKFVLREDVGNVGIPTEKKLITNNIFKEKRQNWLRLTYFNFIPKGQDSDVVLQYDTNMVADKGKIKRNEEKMDQQSNNEENTQHIEQMKTVLDMGFDKDLVRKVIRQQEEKNGLPFTCTAMLIDAILRNTNTTTDEKDPQGTS